MQTFGMELAGACENRTFPLLSDSNANAFAVPSHGQIRGTSKLTVEENLPQRGPIRGDGNARARTHRRGKMIGSNPRERRAVYGYAQRLDRLVNKNVIDSEQWKSRRESANGSRRLNEFADIAQASSKR